MSDLLLGKETSGTPVETRAGTVDFAKFLQNLNKEGGAGFGGLTADALMAILSNPAIAEMLISPTDRTAGLFSSMEPFEAQTTADSVAGVRNIFGSVGGRFGRGVADAEARTRGELGNQFGRARQEALLTADAQRQNFFSQLLQAATQSVNTGMGTSAQFFQGGAPQFTPGILPGLLSAGASIYGASLFKNRPQGGQTAGNIPQITPGFDRPTPGVYGRSIFQDRLRPVGARF